MQLFQHKNLLIIQNIHGKKIILYFNKIFHFFFCFDREKPFALIIVLNANGNAEGDLFYDDGESIDTIGTKSYYYSTYKWSTSENHLTINVIENNYPEMSKKILNTLIIYGLDNMTSVINVNNKQLPTKLRENTQIIEVNNLGLSMTQNYTLTMERKTSQSSSSLHQTEKKYRVDCHPDPGKYIENKDFI